MNLNFSSSFDKSFGQLSKHDQEISMDTIEFFKDSPNHPSLRNHALRGSMSGKRSISVHDDLRIIFIEKGDYIQVLMLDIGDHSSVYGI